MAWPVITTRPAPKRMGFWWLLALGILCTASVAATAAEPGKSIGSPPISDEYGRAVVALMTTAESNADLAITADSDGPPIYFDLNAPLERVAGYRSMAAADKALLRAAMQTYSVHLALGGTPIERFGVVHREAGRLYIGFDGRGGRWVATGRQAIAVMAETLVAPGATDANGGAGGRTATLPCPFDVNCLLRPDAEDAPAFVQRGSVTVLELEGAGFSDRGNGPFALADAGLVVHSTALLAGNRVRLEVAATARAPLGMHRIEVFNVGSALRGVATYDVKVIASEAEIASMADSNIASTKHLGASHPTDDPGNDPDNGQGDDHGDDRASASALTDGAPGRLERPGDRDVFRLVITDPRTLGITSAGPSDVTASLATDVGEIRAEDDDGGDWYNFSLNSRLESGTYYLTVRHCCGGVGPYTLQVQ